MSETNELLLLGEYAESLLSLDFNCELPTFVTNGEKKNVFNYSGMLLESIRNKYRESIISKKAMDELFDIHSKVFFIVTDKEFKIRTLNNEACKFIGIEFEELRDTDIFEVFPDFNMNFSQGFNTSFSEFLNVRSNLEESSSLYGKLIFSRVESNDNEITELIFVFSPDYGQLHRKMKLHSEVKQLDNAIAGLKKISGMKKNDDINSVQLDVLKNLYKVRQSLCTEISREDNSAIEKSRLDFINIHEIMKTISEEIQFTDSIENVIIDISNRSINLFLGDYDRIFLILKNLVLNGIQFQDNSKPNTVIRVNITHQDNGFLISITDNGIGIEKDHLDRIFERNYKINLKNGQFNMGLGLFFVRRSVVELGGEITVTSTIGVGSNFDVYLPAPKRKE